MVRREKRPRTDHTAVGDASVAGVLSGGGGGSGELSETYSRLFGGTRGGSGGFFAAAAAAPPAQRTSALSSSGNTAIRHADSSVSGGGPIGAASKNAPADEAVTSSGSKRKRVRDVEANQVDGKGVEKEIEVSGDASVSSSSRKRTEEENREREARTLFIGNIPLSWGKKELRLAMREAVGDKYDGSFSPIWFRAEPLEDKWTHGRLRKAGSILGAYKKQDAADAKHAYVVLRAPEDVTTLRRVVHGFEGDEKHILRADGVGEQAKLQSFDRKRSVFVGNLPPGTSENDLRMTFAKSGAIDAVRVVRDKETKACKGIAFVLFRERSSVKVALKKWGADIRGRQIRVTKVDDRQEDDSGGQWGSKASHPAEQRLQQKQSLRRRSGKTGRKKGGAAGQNKSAKHKVGFVKAKGSKSKGPKKKPRKMKIKGAQKK